MRFWLFLGLRSLLPNRFPNLYRMNSTLVTYPAVFHVTGYLGSSTWQARTARGTGQGLENQLVFRSSSAQISRWRGGETPVKPVGRFPPRFPSPPFPQLAAMRGPGWKLSIFPATNSPYVGSIKKARATADRQPGSLLSNRLVKP